MMAVRIFPSESGKTAASEYPQRPMLPPWLRYLFMAFGLACVFRAVAFGFEGDPFFAIGGAMVGAAWFAFGKYGGYPLFETVPGWRPAESPNEIDDSHRRGLLVIRDRRRQAFWAIPATLAAMAVLMPVLMPLGYPQLGLLLAAPPMAFVRMRYYLSRCPRCGYGFFTTSTKRAASIRSRSACGHCGLALDASMGR